MKTFELNVNGKSIQVEAEPDMPLLWVLRDFLHLYGTKYGCGIAQCGACTVHLNGTPIRSCSVPVSAIGENEVTTIEGIESNHPVKEAWKTLDVPQCGYCQAGQMMTAVALVDSKKQLSESEIDNAMEGNLCRCSSYTKIKSAVQLSLDTK